jgi:RES domain-containing protein
MILWRISNHATLDGRGGLLASARWHSLGRPILYLAESSAGALLEVLVHLELDLELLPPSYSLLKTEAPQHIKMKQISPADLPRHWRSDQAITREIGDRWLASRETVLMRVPSVIVPETFNVVLNPEHTDARQIKVISRQSYPWDQRLARR